MAHEASVDLREIVSGIEPHALRELGLAAAIAELAERHAARRGVAFDLDLAAADGLGDGAQSGLYQIVRDALDQALRRGPPTQVDDHDRTRPAAASSSGSTDDGGEERREAVLDALAERAAELNGTFASETTPERDLDHDPAAALRRAPVAPRRMAGIAGHRSARRQPTRYGSFWTLCSVAYSSTSASITAAPSGNA